MRLVKKVLLSSLALVVVLALIVIGVRLVNQWRFPEESGTDPRGIASYDLDQEGMEVEQVTGERIAGFHLVPDEVTRDGVVVTFGGSEGGPAYEQALDLAGQGHEVYSLFFFGQENQPEALEQVPLEFFGEVTELIEQGAVRPGPLTVIGTSKGAELALLLAEHYPEIDNVVLFAPTMYAFQGLGAAWPGSSSWSLEGEELPYLSFQSASLVGGLGSQLSAWVFDHPTAYRPTYESVVENSSEAEREAARLDPAAVEGGLLVFAGGIAVAVRSARQWREHPQHIATADEPWAGVVERGDRPPLHAQRGNGCARSRPLPLDGVRVLDLTRVIAGPTGSQLLACLGAGVLRIDPPHRPELLDQHLSTGMGKRSTILDLRDDSDRAQARSLATSADVILTGYRPGALARHGLGPGDLEQLAPQAVIGVLSAWGETGPWGDRAGFDSIVQAASGIAVACGSAERPGALPVQALDHASGHLLAAHVLTALAAGRARTIRVGLLGAAQALLALPVPPAHDPAPFEIPRRRVMAAGTVLDAVPPPLLLDGHSIERTMGGYGAATPHWSC